MCECNAKCMNTILEINSRMRMLLQGRVEIIASYKIMFANLKISYMLLDFLLHKYSALSINLQMHSVFFGHCHFCCIGFHLFSFIMLKGAFDFCY